jgi:hypothetical protein
MIRGGFLDLTIRADLIALVRDGKAETRLTRRANALLLLDDGMSCEAIAKVLYLDDDTMCGCITGRGPSCMNIRTIYRGGRAIEVETEEPTGRRRLPPEKRYVKFPHTWEVALAENARSITDYRVAMEIIRRSRWSKEFTLANGKLGALGVSRMGKYRSLKLLERLGLISVQWQDRKSPRISLP